jgi:excinuclease ABC subunit A
MNKWKEKLILSADKFDFPIYTSYSKLSTDQRELLWKGNRYFKGIDRFFDHLEEKNIKFNTA